MALLTNLRFAFECDEASGNLLESHNSHHATETSGTIGATSGPNAAIGSRQFVAADTEYGEVSDHADLSFGDEEITFEVWVYADTLNGGFVFCKGTAGGTTREYALYNYDHFGSKRMVFEVGNLAGWTGNVMSSNEISIGVWTRIVCKHLPTDNLLSITFNGTETTNSWSNGVGNGTAALQIGADVAAGAYWDGRIALFRGWSKLITSDENRILNNSGYGLAYADFDVAPTTTVIDVDTGGTGDYTVLNTALSTEARNLLPTVGSNEIVIFDCRASGGVADTTRAVVSSSWISDVYHYVVVRSSGSNKHTGTWNTGKYRLDAAGGGAGTSALSVESPYAKIDGLQIKGYPHDFSFVRAVGLGAEGVRIYNCIIRCGGSATGTTFCVLAITAIYTTCYCYNNLFLVDASGFSGCICLTNSLTSTQGHVLYSENNTLILEAGSSIGIAINGFHGHAHIARNNLTYGFGNTNTYDGTLSTGTDYNTTDSTDSIGTGSNNSTSQTFTFTNAAGGDYSLASGDTGARNKGSLLSAVSSGFTTDIIGTARDASGAIDCGCFEYVAVISTSFIYFKRPTRVWNRRL